MPDIATATIGQYLSARLRQAGMQHYFAVPGDYNLVLLDELLKNPDLIMINCCNELNAAYAADGYARATGGPAAIVVTFSVGGLSAINGIAGAYAESLPVIAVSGGPNTNSEAESELLHHTIGLVDYSYQREMFTRVTAASVIVRHAREAPAQIDSAIDTALRLRKPVYLEIPSNLAGAATAAPGPRTLGGAPKADAASLVAAVDHAADVLNAAVKPALVAGVGLRGDGAEAAFAELADACGYAVAVMPNAKSFFSEAHPAFIGTVWGPVSSPGCGEIVESADQVLYAGPTFTDYTTAGHASVLDPGKMIVAQPTGVSIGSQSSYGDVPMAAFLSELARKVKRNSASLDAFNRVREEIAPPADGGDSPITTRQMFHSIQKMLTGDSAIIAETGDSWFNGMRLRLPRGRPLRDPDAVRLDRLVGGRDAWLRAGQLAPRDHAGRRRLVPDDGAGGLDDDPHRRQADHLPDQQRRLHHRGRDPRRSLQPDQELGLCRPRQRLQRGRRQGLEHARHHPERTGGGDPAGAGE